jgi:hypothetical protein
MTANGRRGSARSLLALGAWITWSFRRGTGDRDALAGLELAHAVGVDAVAGPAGEAGPAVPAAILDLVDGLGGLHAAGEPGQVLRVLEANNAMVAAALTMRSASSGLPRLA